jgi:hypothetical protein
MIEMPVSGHRIILPHCREGSRYLPVHNLGEHPAAHRAYPFKTPAIFAFVLMNDCFETGDGDHRTRVDGRGDSTPAIDAEKSQGDGA